MADFDNNFDLEFRSIIESGSETLPEGLWAGIAGAVPAAVGKPAHLWSTVAASTASVAVATGVTLAVVLGGNPDIDQIPESPVEIVVADSLTAENIPVESEDVYYVVAAPDQTTIKKSEESVISAEETEEVPQETAQSPEADEVTPSAPEQGQETAKAKPEEPVVQSSGDKTGDKKVKVSLGAYASVATNGLGAKAATGNDVTPASASAISESSLSSFKVPVSAGLNLKLHFTPRWALAVGVDYSYLAREFSGSYTPEGGAATSYSRIKNTQQYIAVPINAYFSFINNDIADFYIFAGGSIGKCITNKFAMGDPGEAAVAYKGETGGLQYSAGGGLGVDFKVGDHFGIYLDPSVRYWFNTNQPKSVRTEQPVTVQVELGLRYNF